MRDKRGRYRTRSAKEFVCLNCGDPYVAKRSDSETCGDRCRQARYRARLKAAAAGTPTTVTRRCA